MKHVPLIPEMVEKVYIHPQYKDIPLKEKIYYNCEFFGNIYIDSFRMRKSFVLLKPKFRNMNIRLYPLTDLSDKDMREYILLPTTEKFSGHKLDITDPVIITEERNEYIVSVKPQHLFLDTDKNTMAKLKLLF